MNKNKAQIYCFAFALGVLGIMAYYAFVTVNCLAYPWWVGLGSDGDGTYVTQTLLLLNNGPLQLVFHPGATVYGLLGIILRVVDSFDPAHIFLNLQHMKDPAAVFVLLDHAMHISRIVIFLLNVLCLLVFWRVLYQISKDLFLSLGLSGVLMTAFFMMDLRVFIVRPELTSFIFCIALFSLLLSVRQKRLSKEAVGIPTMIMIGVLGGFAILAKVQAILLVGPLALWWFWNMPGMILKKIEDRVTWTAVSIAVINTVIMPWGWFKRPDFLLGYLKELYYAREEHQMYGPAPDTVAPVYMIIMGILLLLSIASICWPHRFGRLLAKVLVGVGLFQTGIIVSCYAVFLGLGQSFSAYNAASNHLLYALTTNVLYGGAANHRVIDAATVKAVINLHLSNHLAGIGILWYVAAAVGLCLFRLWQTSVRWRAYVLILFLCVSGMGIDIISSFRQYFPGQVIIICTYAIYSLPVYLCALAVLCTAELSSLSDGVLKLRVRRLVYAVLVVHMVMIAAYVIKMPKWDVKNNRGQTPDQEMLNTLSAVPDFWHRASQGRI